MNDEAVVENVDVTELLGNMVKHEFDKHGSHRLVVGEKKTAWRVYTAPVLMRVNNIMYVGITGYFGEKEMVVAFACLNTTEACTAERILGIL